MKKVWCSLIPVLNILLALAFTSAVFAGTVTVTTTADELDGNVSSIANLIATPGGTGISLREAITAANNTPGADEILFDSSINGIPITLTGAPHDNSNLSGDLDIRSDMTIRGNGKSLTIIQAGTTASNGVDRVFDVFAPASTTITATIENLTVRHGRTGITGVALVNRGAGISVHADNLGTANLSVIDALVTLNTNLNASGGGIDIIKRDNGSVPTLDILRSEISENSSFQSGGGVICTDGDLTVTESLISNNFSNENTNLTGGAGIFMGGPEATTATITNTTITGNRTNGSGAGIVNSNDTVILNFVTVTLNLANDDNDAAGLGGGLRQIGVSGSMTVSNSIVQGNTTNGNAAAGDCSGTITSGGFNVVGAGAGFPVGPNDTTGDANLGPLQNNGGSTKTHALLCNSAAIDFANCGSITTDQIGNPRNDGSCDAGAFERQLSAGSVITVTTATDELDGDVSSIANLIATPGGTGISLREAISACNNTPGADEIRFASGINGAPIVLNIGSSHEDANVDGDLDILDCDGLTITGNGESNTIIDGNETERVIDHYAGDLTITGVTIQNGNSTSGSFRNGGGIQSSLNVSGSGEFTMSNCTLTGNDAGRFGGAIYLSSTGKETLNNCTFSNNHSGLSDPGGNGGAVRISGASDSEAKISACTFANNSSNGKGGALDYGTTDGKLVLDGSIFTGNNAAEDGGALHANPTNGTAIITNSAFSGNSAGVDGGGLSLVITDPVMLQMSNCTVSNNTAGRDGGGIDFDSSVATFSIINSTISGNRANRHGGGIAHNSQNSVLNLNFVTLTNNIADDDTDGSGEGGGVDINELTGPATVNIQNSIVQGNDAEGPPGGSSDDCGASGGIGTYVSQGGNVFGTGSGCPTGANDTTDPANLGPLQNNGGATETHALLAGSAAINFADCGSITTDQRGEPRNDGSCDAGAFEAALSPADQIAAQSEALQACIDATHEPEDLKPLKAAKKALQKAHAAALADDIAGMLKAMRDAAKALSKVEEDEGCDTEAIASALADLARQIAVEKKAEALDCNPNPTGKMAKKIQDGDKDFVAGDKEYAGKDFSDAIKDYTKAWEGYDNALGRCLPKAGADDDDEEVTSEQSPVTSYELEQNYPNPFNPTTVISFQLPVAGEVNLSIYNMSGQLMKRLVAGQMSAGRHNITWNATDQRGQRVASGVYLYVIKAGEFMAQKKLVLMK